MIAAWIIATAGIANPEGELRLSSLFTDHMVLQRSQTICVKGYARPSAKVQVKFAEEIGSTVADGIGGFKVVFQILGDAVELSTHRLDNPLRDSTHILRNCHLDGSFKAM